MAVGDVYRLTVANNLNGQYALSVLHYYTSAITTGGSAAELNTAFIAAALTPWQNAVSSDVSFAYTLGQRIWPLPILLPVQDNNWSGTGAGASPALPPADAAVIRKRTALAGRRYRGRVFVAGIPASSASAGAIAGGEQTLLATLGTALQAPLTDAAGNVYQPALYQGGGSVSFILTTAIDPVLRTQRRRQLGKGV